MRTTVFFLLLLALAIVLILVPAAGALAGQDPAAQATSLTAPSGGSDACVDCHKGVAHHLPDMGGVEGWQ